MVFNDGPNIECLNLYTQIKKRCKFTRHGYTHISFYVDDFEASLNKIKQAGDNISEPHSNTKYEDTDGNRTVYVKNAMGEFN